VTHAQIKLRRTSTLILWSPRLLMKYPRIQLVSLHIAGAMALCHVKARLEADHECTVVTEEYQKYSEENLCHCQFVHHKCHMDCPRIDPGPPR
jgi:hypothetical protein